MAKLDKSGTYVVVEKGDTLSQIALDYKSQSGGKTYKQLASLNNIKNPDLIYVGQKIYLKTATSSSSSSNNQSAPTIKQFGLSADPESTNVLFATWTWGKSSQTEKYQVEWKYYTTDKYWAQEDSETTHEYCSFNIPNNAKEVRFRVKPISKTKTENGKEVKYFAADWASEYNGERCSHKVLYVPASPTSLSVNMEGLTLTMEVSNLEDDPSIVQFEIVQNDATTYKTKKVSVQTASASYSCDVKAGNKYKVRCRSNKDGVYSNWSVYSSNYDTPPSAPSKFSKCEPRALDPVAVYLAWEKVENAESYDIEYTTKKSNFDGSDQVQSKTGITTNTYELSSGIETGKEYFFRVRAVNQKGSSKWSEISSTVIGTGPAAPTTWSSSTTVISGEPLILYWVHNTEDGSSQTYAQLEVYVNNTKVVSETFDYTDDDNPTTEKDDNKTRSYQFKMVNDNGDVIYPDGAKITWRVRTAGISNTFGDWSILRMVDVYAPPTLDISVTDSNGDLIDATVRYRVNYEVSSDTYVTTTEKVDALNGTMIEGAYTTDNEQVYSATSDSNEVIYYVERTLDTLKSLPFRISASAGPNTQKPIGYHVSIVANEFYETTDSTGNSKSVVEGSLVYSKHFDVADQLDVELSAGDMSLENGISYTINVTVSMDSGLTAEASVDVIVLWESSLYTPNAEIGIDVDDYTAYIRPYCSAHKTVYYKAELVNNQYYVATEEVLDNVYGEIVNGTFTMDGQQIYYGATADSDGVYYCVAEEETRITDVLLAVYRREFDGTFTELATGLDGAKNTFVTDPHPALDYARYRIVATSKTTGAVSYYDAPGYPVSIKAAILQWDEEWTTFDTFGNDDELEKPAWSGSLLVLPYNIDVSNKHSTDVTFAEYIGRKHPVSYYGTQLGETATWSMVIPKDDRETLYALRRLAIWTGDVYVREPSGSGYWANVSVSFNQKHLEMSIPVSLDITRVEGGA